MCRCAIMPDALYVSDQPQDFAASFREITVGDWVRLLQCETCGQHWTMDEWDKYQVQCAAKVASQTDWQALGDGGRKQLLLRSRGGLSSTECGWTGCGNRAVNGVALCVDHLFEAGVRQ